MGDLPIHLWLREIQGEIRSRLHLISSLHRIGKHEWAEHLAEEARIMQEAARALEFLRRKRSKRRGFPLLWLRANKEANDLEAKRQSAKAQRGETGD